MTTGRAQNRIVFVGAAHLDRIGRLDQPAALGCSNPGKFEQLPGGTALNVSRILARLGHQVELVTLLGKDEIGQWLKDILARENVMLNPITSCHARTGSYTSIMDPDGSVVIALADMEINNQFSADLAADFVNSTTGDDWLCVDANLPQDQLEPLLELSAAKKAGFTVSKAKAARLRDILPNLDILFTNCTEARALLALEENREKSTLLDKLTDAGVTSAVVTDGPAPVQILHNCAHHELPVKIPEQVLDVTGAGDALAATTLHYLDRGTALVGSVEKGIQAASAIIQVRGAIWHDLADQLK
ncbi:MAG: PfkB family carbohydrate kinase [Rhizobiaceae bacterium]